MRSKSTRAVVETNQEFDGRANIAGKRPRRRLAKAMSRSVVLATTVGLLTGSLSVVSDARVAHAEEETESCYPDADMHPGWRCGYISVPGGSGAGPAELFYYLRLPTREEEVPGQPGETVIVELEGPFPTVLHYQGYGSGPGQNLSDFERSLLKDGYAVLVMTVRGTGCSNGVWDPFQEQEAYDAKYVIDEWIAQQPWSNGRVGMVGGSYAAITQLPVAATRPEHLMAIAPILPIGDLYRDAVYPGGIYNPGVVSFFTAYQGASSASYAAAQSALVQEEWAPELPERRRLWTECAERQDSRAAAAQYSPAVQWPQHPYDDDFWRSRLAAHRLDHIDVPVFLMTAWQDQVVGGRAIESLSGINKLHGIVTNGGHFSVADAELAQSQLRKFLAHYVMGEDNGFGEEPRIQVWWETGRDGVVAPGWVTNINQWPAPQTKTQHYFLSGDGTTPGGGALEQDQESVTGDADAYAYAGPTGRSALPSGSGLPAGSWNVPPRPGASLTYTTTALTDDVAVLGSASLDLWLSATATDTDVQVTLSEIRDYGGSDGVQEVFVQQGWLRASHRSVDAARSRETLPYHSHTEADARPLTPGVIEAMRVEILPFAHLFRKGSRIRVTIEAPKGVNDAVWWFESFKTPSVNSVHHDTAYPSQLVLPVIPGHEGEALSSYPKCGTVLDQPCRRVAT